ncbi:hypothetical protein PR001_g27307, partial [Phytophthora rubi]
MVRRASLRVDGYVFLLPEQVDGITEYPFYANVMALSSESATTRSIDLDDPVNCDIDVAEARSAVVTKVEATRTRLRKLLRQAAWTESAARFWHGQVVGIEGRLARLQLEDRVVLVEPARLTPVAPVVAILLLRVPLHAPMSRDGLLERQATILARILDGSAGSPASNAIPTLLEGLVEPSDMPDGHSTCQWIDPRSGQTRTFRVQHAVDYAFVMDGSQPAPTALRLSVGSSFCSDPRFINTASAVRHRDTSIPLSPTASVDQVSSIVSLFAQELDEHSVPVKQDPEHNVPVGRVQFEPSPDLHASHDNPAPAHPPARRSPLAGQATVQSSISANRASPSLDARIMEQLLQQPELLAHFVQVIATAGTSRTTAPATGAESARRTSKYAFTPTSIQAVVHDYITSPEHRGKHPYVFVESVIHALAVRFQPHPGILIRLYDFQFGMLGLSILHFAPFGVQQRMMWLNAGGVNMQNFSAGVAAPKPPVASSVGDLVDAARMLCRYGQEFFVQPVRDVLEALLDFLQQLDGWDSWMPSDLPHLVYWANSVLEQFRSHVHASDGDVHTSSLQTIQRLSLNDGELQNDVQCSPFGAVEKKGVDPQQEVRPIHDLSFPESTSTNDFFDATCAPDSNYISVAALARRIEWLATTNPSVGIRILKGDVKSAFRHLMLHAEHVRWMGATLPAEDALVIDLAATFGWSGSPAYYGAFSGAITWLEGTNSPATVSDSDDSEAFFGYEWVDDHILIEPDRDNRLELAESTLRLSMMAVLGPNSINDAKFSPWSTELQALGLVWNTVDRTVSMPLDKVQKCRGRVEALLCAERATKQQLQKLLGSLRHLTTCLRSAKPFFQQLQSACTRLQSFQSVRLNDSSRRDLQWFYHILSDGHLDNLPLRFFGTLPVPTINLYMDASDAGLVVLHPSRNEFIQIRFDDE